MSTCCEHPQHAPEPGRPVVAVVGATATGKSDLAVRLALRLAGEVVNADSMQLYRGMDIGTAKPTPDERRGVAHHVLDIWPVTADASVADYQRRARTAMSDIAGRGRLPILIGGSGLYVGAALDDLAFPVTDPAVRARLEADAGELGATELHRRLAVSDPEAAARIDPGNVRRVVRAMEVIELTGAPFSATLPRAATYAVPAVQVGLFRADPDLDQRIEQRVQRMFRAGLVAEVTDLATAGLRRGVTAARALGYAQVLTMLDSGAAEAVAVQQTAAATRRFARRQRTWFRRDGRIMWFDAADPDLERRALAHLEANGVTVAS